MQRDRPAYDGHYVALRDSQRWILGAQKRELAVAFEQYSKGGQDRVKDLLHGGGTERSYGDIRVLTKSHCAWLTWQKGGLHLGEWTARAGLGLVGLTLSDLQDSWLALGGDTGHSMAVLTLDALSGQVPVPV